MRENVIGAWQATEAASEASRAESAVRNTTGEQAINQMEMSRHVTSDEDLIHTAQGNSFLIAWSAGKKRADGRGDTEGE